MWTNNIGEKDSEAGAEEIHCRSKHTRVAAQFLELAPNKVTKGHGHIKTLQETLGAYGRYSSDKQL